MNITECPSCDKELRETASFCNGCGSQVRCTNCKEILIADSNFCDGCGTKVGKQKENSEATNTFEFTETADGRSMKASFTDPAVKDIAQAITSFVSNKQIALGTNGKRNENQNTETIAIEVEDAELVTQVTSEEKQKSSQTTVNLDIPDLKNLVYRRLPSSESEWMLIYACYSTNFKLEPVTLETLKEYYVSSGRKTDSNQRNIKTNLGSLIKGLYIEYINDNEFVVTDKGFNHAKEILARTSASESTNKGGRPSSKVKKASGESTESKTSKSKSATSSDELKMLDDLDLNPTNGQGLKDFVTQYKASSNYERNLVYTYYLKEVLKLQEPVSYNHIYTCYRWLDEKFPNALTQSIKDTKSNKQWLSYSKLTDIRVSPKGMNQIKDLKIT